MEWAPVLSDEVANVATSGEPADRVPLPRLVDPSLNVTVPVGMAPLPATVAVKVTELPYVEVGEDDVTLIVTEAFVTGCNTAFDVDVK